MRKNRKLTNGKTKNGQGKTEKTEQQHNETDKLARTKAKHELGKQKISHTENTPHRNATGNSTSNAATEFVQGKFSVCFSVLFLFLFCVVLFGFLDFVCFYCFPILYYLKSPTWKTKTIDAY